MGGLELLRTSEALTYAWTPQLCQMHALDPYDFDRWLGRRVILFLGDSLTAQHYFSLKFMLGDMVVEQVDDLSETFPDDGNYDKLKHVEDSCTETVIGNEGGWFGWFRLRGGGMVYRVMQHAPLFKQLEDIENAWWKAILQESDIVVMNVGHHYHTVDAHFRKYDQLTELAAQQFKAFAMPKTQVGLTVPPHSKLFLYSWHDINLPLSDSAHCSVFSSSFGPQT